jgi:hypothetical protein
MSFESAALVATWVAIMLLGLAMAGLVRQVTILRNGPRLRSLSWGPVIGSHAPTVGSLGEIAGPMALFFADAECLNCGRLLPKFVSLAQNNGSMDHVVVFSGTANGYDTRGVRVLTNQREAFQAYRIPVTPFGVVVTDRRIIARAGAIGSDEALLTLLRPEEERGDK